MAKNGVKIGAMRSDTKQKKQRRPKIYSKDAAFVFLVGTCLICTVTFNLLHLVMTDGAAHSASLRAADRFLRHHFQTSMHENSGNGDGGDGDGDRGAAAPASTKETSGREESKAEEKKVESGPPSNEGGNDDEVQHRIGSLACEKYGGPSNDVAEEMIYWSDIPSDSAYASPFKKEGEVKYMTFEPDGACVLLLPIYLLKSFHTVRVVTVPSENTETA